MIIILGRRNGFNGQRQPPIDSSRLWENIQFFIMLRSLITKNNVTQATARAVIERGFSISTYISSYILKYILLFVTKLNFFKGPDDVKNKWKQFRDTFWVEEKRLSEEHPSGSGLDGSKRLKKMWVYYNQLGFLNAVYDDDEYAFILLTFYLSVRIVFSLRFRRTSNLDNDVKEK